MKSLIITVSLFLLLRVNNDPLQLLIENESNPWLKSKLITFQAEGTEQAIDSTLTYDVEDIINHAESFVGTPHRMGGMSNKGLDCSGLVMLAHQHVGINLPHSSHEQARYGQIILAQDSLKRGDLVFFHSTYKTDKLVTHSAIYLGEGNFIHASAKRGVTISSFVNSEYYNKHYLFGTRLRK